MVNQNHPTKLAILQAAFRVFGEKGFKGTTTKEIALEANVAEGTLFRYFPSKLDILYGVVDTLITSIGVEPLQNFLGEINDLPTVEALQYIILNRMETIGAGKDLIRIILTEAQYDEHLREVYVEQVFKPIQQILSSFFEQKMANGECREMNPKLPANILLSSIFFTVISQHLLTIEAEDNIFEASELTNILLYGIQERLKP